MSRAHRAFSCVQLLLIVDAFLLLLYILCSLHALSTCGADQCIPPIWVMVEQGLNARLAGLANCPQTSASQLCFDIFWSSAVFVLARGSLNAAYLIGSEREIQDCSSFSCDSAKKLLNGLSPSIIAYSSYTYRPVRPTAAIQYTHDCSYLLLLLQLHLASVT